MKNLQYKTLLGAIGATALMMSAPSQAAFNWTFDSGSSCGFDTPVTSCSKTDNGNTVTATGWSTNASLVTAPLEQGMLGRWSGGLGVQNTKESFGGSPNHATDNSGRFDALSFDFTTAVALTKVSMGWVENDADFSLLRYVSGDSSIAGKTYSQLIGSGGSWELVGNYNSLSGSNSQTAHVNGVGGNYDAYNLTADFDVTSSKWLVAAMNGSLGWSGGILDHFKLKSLAGDIPRVPEPSTLALMSISILAFGFTQRRRKKV